MRTLGHLVPAAITLAMCAAAPAIGQTEQSVTPEEAEARDLEQIAKIKGISLEEATRRKELIQQAIALDEQLEQDATYGGLRIVSTAQEFYIDMRFSRAGQTVVDRRNLPAALRSALKVSDGAVPRIDANRVRTLIQTLMTRANLKGKRGLRAALPVWP